MKKLNISVTGTLVILIPLVVIGLFTIISFTRVTDKMIDENIITIAQSEMNIAESAIMDEFEPAIASLHSIAAATRTNQDFAMISHLLRNIAAMYDSASYYWTTVTPLPQGGTLIMSYDWAPPNAEWDQSTRPWYIGAMKNPGELFCYAYLNVRTNAYCISFTEAILDDRRTPVGVVGFDIGLSELSKIVNNIRTSEHAQTYLIEQDGTYVTNPDSRKIMSGNYFEDIAAATRTPKNVVAQYFGGSESASLQGDSYYANRRVGITPWLIVTTGPVDDFTSALKQTIVLISAVLAVIIILTIVINSSYVNKVQAKAGALGKQLAAEMETINAVITDVTSSRAELGSAGNEMEASAQDTASSITQILANIESMHGQITNQSASVEETAGAVNQIASNIESLERMIETQSSGVTQASAAVEEMIGNIQSVNASVDKMALSFGGLQRQATQGAEKQRSVNEKIAQIESQSKMLQEANQAIASIASQTNLLAMNAAIEAAHAGDAGKGFAVVSDEIRKLSETSSTQSRTIGEQLKVIQASIMDMVSVSQESSSAFNAVSGGISQTDQLVRQIKAAMEEQQAGSRQITDALHAMNDSTVEVRSSAAEMAAGNKSILEEVRQLQNVTASMKDSMDEMAVGARKINDTGAALNTIGAKMQSVIAKIGTQIDRFKAS